MRKTYTTYSTLLENTRSRESLVIYGGDFSTFRIFSLVLIIEYRKGCSPQSLFTRVSAMPELAVFYQHLPQPVIPSYLEYLVLRSRPI